VAEDPVKALARLAAKLRWLVLPRGLNRMLRKASGFEQVLLSAEAIDAALSDPVVQVPYAEPSRAVGLEAFPLALDGEAHTDAREVITGILEASSPGHERGVEEASAAASAAVDGASGRIDVVAQMVDPALAVWVDAWFGLPGMGADLQRAGRLAMHTIFLNQTNPLAAADSGAREVARRYLDEVRARIIEAAPAASADTVVGALRDEGKVDDDLLATHVLGLTVGPLALGSWVLADAIDGLLDREGQVVPITSEAHARRILEELMVAKPPLPGVPRVLHHPLDLKVGGASIQLPAGHVLALTGGVTETPGSDDPARWVFGVGPHACMGRTQITAVGAAILQALSRGRPTRSAGPAGTLAHGAGPSRVRGWAFPGHLVVDLHPVAGP
jgi:cytochrome P450